MNLSIAKKEGRTLAASSRRVNSRGGALIEFLISLPLLVVFLVGLLSSGRLLGSVATTGQAAFLGGLLVTQITNTADVAVIPARVQKILCLQRGKTVTMPNPSGNGNITTVQSFGPLNNLNCGGAPGSLVTISEPNPASDTVVIDVHGDYPFMFTKIDIDLRVVAPYLILNESVSSEFQAPANPDPVYSCEGGPNAIPCVCCVNAPAVVGDYCRTC